MVLWKLREKKFWKKKLINWVECCWEIEEFVDWKMSINMGEKNVIGDFDNSCGYGCLVGMDWGENGRWEIKDLGKGLYY